jgi:hypothetical protein
MWNITNNQNPQNIDVTPRELTITPQYRLTEPSNQTVKRCRKWHKLCSIMKEPYPNRTYKMQSKARIHKVTKAELYSFPNYSSTPPVRM